jgi:uncharacterized membrane protein
MMPHDLIDLRLIAIAAMAIVSFLIRAGGFWLMGRVPLTPRVRRMLEALPGSIVAAAVLPIAAKTGAVTVLAIAVAVATMVLRGNALAGVAAGMASAVVARAAGL